MRTLFLVAAVLLTACGTVTPLQELEREALRTGDWSKVEQRERMLARRSQRTAASCPFGQVAVCDEFMGNERCTCIKSESLANALNGGFR